MAKRVFYIFFIVALIGCEGGANDDNQNLPKQNSSNIIDPAPEFNSTGEYGCDGCPDSDVSSFDQNLGNITSNTFSGIVTNADGNGEFYLSAQDGRAIFGSILTNTNTGEYSFEVPLFCGEQLLKTIWTNSIGKYVLVIKILTENCTEPDIRVVLTWDDIGIDWELHLVKEGGRINDNATDCTWTSCINSSPDWGVQGVETDNPTKDVDNTGSFGPENIFLSKPENQIYTVMVEHWNGNGSNESDGKVIILLKNNSQIFSINDFPPFHVWTVATIKWPEAMITPVNTVFDCSVSWSSGCWAEIP